MGQIWQMGYLWGFVLSWKEGCYMNFSWKEHNTYQQGSDLAMRNTHYWTLIVLDVSDVVRFVQNEIVFKG